MLHPETGGQPPYIAGKNGDNGACPRGSAVFLLAIALSLLSGCASYGDWVGKMEDRIAHQDPQSALQILEQHAGERNRDAVLLLMNRAMLLRMQGDFEGSSGSFEQAKALLDVLLVVSITEQAGALAVSDAQRSFTGEPFERVMLHVYAALNYLETGETGKARVEALQLDVLLEEFERNSGFYGNAFARWLSGMIFEALGERGDAMVAYRKAWQAYHRYPESFAVRAPAALGRDLVRLSGQLGLTDEQQRYREEFGMSEDTPEPDQGAGSGDAEVIFLLHSGLAPVKHETGMVVPTDQGRLVSIAMPYYLSRSPWVTRAELRTVDASARAELAEDIDAVAVAALEQQAPAILARAVARAVVKYQVSRAFDKENELAGLIANIAGVISERADTRSWSTLPNRIYAARLPLPAGEHLIGVELRDRSGRIESQHEYRMVLTPGDKRFISLHQVAREDLYPVHIRRRGQ